MAFSKEVKICLCHLSVLNISFTVNMFWGQLSKTLIIFYVTHPSHKTLDVLELWNTTSPLLLKITLCIEKQTNLFCWNKDAFLLCSLKSIFSFLEWLWEEDKTCVGKVSNQDCYLSTQSIKLQKCICQCKFSVMFQC